MFNNPQYIPGLQAVACVEFRSSKIVASCGLRLDRCSTSLPESSVMLLGSAVVAQKTMAQWLSVLKITQLSPDATELPLSTVRLTLAAPVSSEKMTAADVRRTMEGAGFLPAGVRVALYYKDEEGDFVNLPSPDAVWPSCGISDGVLKAWYICVPDPPGTTTPTPVCACLGPHLHQPEKKKLATLDKANFEGYSLLAAAGDGCVSCVEYWLGNGADPNFESSSSRYTAMDFVRWSEKKSHISSASAKQVQEVLVAAGGRANKM